MDFAEDKNWNNTSLKDCVVRYRNENIYTATLNDRENNARKLRDKEWEALVLEYIKNNPEIYKEALEIRKGNTRR